MPSITILTSTGPRWGDSAFNSSTSELKVGKSGTATYYGYVGFPALNPAWAIKSISLKMNRNDTYSSKVLQFGSSTSNAWGSKGTQDWKADFTVSSGTGTKTWSLTAYKDILQGYTGTWYLHVQHGSGSNSYCEFNGGMSSTSPRLVIEYEDSSVTVPGDQFTIGVQSAMTVGNADSGLTHDLSYSIGAASGVLATGVTAGATVNWTPAASLANQITTDMVGDVTLTLKNYLAGVLQTTRTLTFPLNVPASYVPTISSAPLALQNPVNDTIGVYVQNRSWVKCTVTAAQSYSAPIVEYRLTIGGVTTSSATNVITTGALAVAGTLTGYVVAVDSRGQASAAFSVSAITVYEYFAPMVTSFTLLRCDSGGVASNIGTYMKYVVSVVFASINSLNSKAGTIAFKVAGAPSYGTAVALSAIPAYSTTVSGVIGGGGITSAGYMAQVTLMDRYNNIPIEAALASSKLWFDLHGSGEGMAVGKAASAASAFDVGLDSRFDGVVALGENGQYGNKNLLSNVGMLADSSGWWSLTTNVTRDTTRTLMGCNSAKSMQSGNASDVWRGGGGSNNACAPGDVISHSMYVWVDDYTTFGGGQLNVNIEFRNSGGSVVQYIPKSLIPTAAHNGKWTRLSVDGAVAPAGTAYWAFRFYVVRNGTAWFACPKVEKGPIATEFVTNVEGDVNFKGRITDGLTVDGPFRQYPEGRRFAIAETDCFANDCAPFANATPGGGTVDNSPGEPNHPGILVLSSGTSNPSGKSFYTYEDAFLLARGETVHAIFNTVNNGNLRLRIGFCDAFASNSAAVVDCCMLSSTSGLIVGKCMTNSAYTDTATSFTPVVGTWYHAIVKVESPTLARFTILDDAGTVQWTDTVTTNIPTAAGRNVGAGFCAMRTSTTAGQLVKLDYLSLSIDRDLIR